MKRILFVLAVVLMFSPVAAYGQKWIEPQMKSDGTMVEGHWQTPEEARQAAQAKPGPVNPYPGPNHPYPGRWGGPGFINPDPMAPSPLDPLPSGMHRPRR